MDFDAISIESRWRRAVCRVKWKWKKEKLKKRPFSILEIPSFWGTVTQDCFPFLNHQCFFWKLNSTTEIWGKNEFVQSFLGELFGSFQTDVDLNYTVIPIMQIDLWPTFEILTYYFILNAFFAVNLEELWKPIWEINDWKCLDLFLFEISAIAVMLDNISCHLSQKLSHKHSCRLFV